MKVGIGSLIYFKEEGKLKSEVLEKVSFRIMEEINLLAANMGEV